MKLLVCGGRDYDDRAKLNAVLDYVQVVLSEEDPPDEITLVIHGACGWNADEDHPSLRPMQGADKLADEWAEAHGVEVKRVPAAWTSLGRKAGPIRNSAMLAYQPDVVIAFPGGRGTANMVRTARAAGLPTYEVKPREMPNFGRRGVLTGSAAEEKNQ